jgi:hypothetical protein
MAWYRKTKPETYLNTSASNFTDSSKNWRKHSNIYRKTSGDETASLTAVPGRYTDSTRTWRRIKAIYKFSGSSWQKVFSKFSGQPYTTRNPEIRVTGYNGTQVDSYEMMGPGTDSIARGLSGTTYLWGWDATEYWENVSGSTATERSFYKSDVDSLQDGVGNTTEITNTESSGDKLRNASGYIDLHDGRFIFYRVRKINGSSIGTANSDGVYLTKQSCSISSISFYQNNSVQAEIEKTIDFSVSNNWYDKPDYSKSYVAIHELDSQFQSLSTSNLKQKIFLQDSYGSGGDRYISYTPGLSSLNKYLYVQLVLKNSYNDSNNDNAPGSDVVDNIVALITGPVPKVVTAPVASSPSYNTLSVTNGAWDYTGSQYEPVSYSYLWQYNDQGSLWLNINQSEVSSGSVTSNSLVLNTNFYSSFPVRCVVTATNVNGSSLSSNSNHVYVTGGTAPSGGSASISGTGSFGSELTLTKVDAEGIPSPTVSWKWRINDGGFSGGTFAGGTIVQTGGATYTPTYTIAGWTNKVRAEVTWTNGVSPDQVVITNEIIITASYTVSWNVNGGNTTHASATFSPGGSVVAPTPTRSGYTFLYWRDTTSGDYTYSVNAGGTFSPPSQNITMYARWTAVVVNYTVTWNPNGGSVEPTSSTFAAGGSVVAPTPTRTGDYAVGSWRDTPSGDILYTVNPGDTFFPPSQNITMYMRWITVTYGSCDQYDYTVSTSSAICIGYTSRVTTTYTFYNRKKVYHNNVDTGSYVSCPNTTYSFNTDTGNSPSCGYVLPNPCSGSRSVTRRCSATESAAGCCLPGALSGCGGSGATSFSC